MALGLASCAGGGGGDTAPLRTLSTGESRAGNPPVLRALPEVVSVNGVARLTLQAKFDAAGRPAFFWNGREGAPVIRVHPGDTIALWFRNGLPEYCSVGVIANANLHFHGFSSAPQPPGDDVLGTNASPGTSVHYSVRVGRTQPPGLYWYHAHPHGLSSYEVGNGMAGAIVVEGIGNVVPRTAGLRERILVLSDIPDSVSFAAGEESVLQRGNAHAPRDLDESPLGGNACAAERDGRPQINGAPFATIGIRPGETQLFRVVNTSAHRHFDLSIDGHRLQLVAQDGVPLREYPGAPATITVGDVVIAPGARAEFLITGGSGPAGLISKCFRSGKAGDNDPEVALGVLTDDTNWPRGPAGTTSGERVRRIATVPESPYYHSRMSAPAVRRLIHFEEDNNGFYINHAAYDPAAAPQIVARSGTVEEWTLENDTQEVHTFHIHQVHFALENINGVAEPNPHWLDTVDLPPESGPAAHLIPSRTKVLIDFRDPTIRGTFVFHCHILDHEDGGMMAKITVR